MTSSVYMSLNASKTFSAFREKVNDQIAELDNSEMHEIEDRNELDRDTVTADCEWMYNAMCREYLAGLSAEEFVGKLLTTRLETT